MIQSDSDQCDVAILGSGIAGLCLASFLGHYGLTCAIIDEPKIAGFASTRNQSWLQSGAAYVAYRQVGVPAECWSGFQWLQRFARSTGALNALASDIPAYLLVRNAAERDEIERGCAAAGIPAEPVRLTDIDSPLTADSPFSDALRVPDCPIDTTRMLELLAQEAAQTGRVRWVPTPSLHHVSLSRSRNDWLVTCGETSIVCRSVVLACGAFIPSMLAKLDPMAAQAYQATKIIVAVLQDSRLADAMLITPTTGAPSPNLVPFRIAERTGVTVCLQGADVPIRSADDFSQTLSDHHRQASELGTWFPNFAGIAASGTIPAHFYACQKLQRVGSRHRGPIVDAFSGNLAGLIAYYPGKFTTAAVSAEILAGQLAQSEGRRSTVRSAGVHSPVDPAPPVTQRVYGRPATHDLVSTREGLHFTARSLDERFDLTGVERAGEAAQAA